MHRAQTRARSSGSPDSAEVHGRYRNHGRLALHRGLYRKSDRFPGLHSSLHRSDRRRPFASWVPNGTILRASVNAFPLLRAKDRM